MTSKHNSSSATTFNVPKGATSSRQAGAMSRWLASKLLEATGQPAIRIRLWDGTEVGNPKSAIATLHIHNRATLFRLITRPDLNFGEAYMSGDAEVEGDLVNFLEAVYRSMDQAPAGALQRLGRRLRSGRRSNSLSGSRNNIHHHYDIGNDFYRLWLDTEAMQYTCAYFPTQEATLEEAQIAKLDHVCRKLRLQPGETVVEAGCGWGGLARHMARHYGVKVRAYNISHEQVAFARERAKAEGLDGRVEYIEDDYRTIDGKFDAFVSVGMLEHVGPEYFPELGDVIDRALTERGRGLIHTIGRNRPAPMNAWIERRIFPGAHPPALSEMMNIFEHHQFSVLDVENLRLHYAETLRHWLNRFEAHQEDIHAQFDEPFIRAWRLYLAGSISAFTTGELQLFQVVFNRGRNNEVPWTREHLYHDTTGA